MSEKIKKPFYKRWWFIVLCVIVVIGAIGSMGNEKAKPETVPATAPASSQDTAQPSSSQAETESSSSANETKTPNYKDGTYLVNKDIPSGLYRAKISGLSGMGYVERASDVTMEFDDIIANIALTGDGYVYIQDTDVAVKLQMVTLEPVDLDSLAVNIKSEVSDGIYLVGYDIAPGTYKVEITDTTMNMGYVERLKNVSMDFDDIIANEAFQGPGYVKVVEGDFAVRVQGAKLTIE